MAGERVVELRRFLDIASASLDAPATAATMSVLSLHFRRNTNMARLEML
jgi:hypothetical protein